MTDLTKAEAFFFEHAGSSYDPATETEAGGRMRGAKALAEAEKWASEAGVFFRWVDDEDAAAFANVCACGEDHGPAFSCIAFLDGESVASLGSVTFGDAGLSGDPYRRVVEAELAAEIMEASTT